MFENLFKIVRSFGAIAKENYSRIMVALGKNATGQTIESIRSEIKFDLNDGFESAVYGSEAFKFIEEGRAAGSKLPPPLVLRDWMAARGIPESKEFAVRKSIAQKGIAPVPIQEMAFMAIEKEFKAKTANAILQDLSQGIWKTIQRYDL